MRYVWVGGAILLALLAAMVLFGSCQRSAVNASLERSSAPLLVPVGEWRDDFEFTAPPGATDLYELRWNFSPGATDFVSGWQVAATSSYDQATIAEGPGQALVDQALQAARGEGCELVDAATELQLCTYPSEFARGGLDAYLVRLVDNHVLVIGYNNLGGERNAYNPDDLAARFINAEFEPVPIDGDIGDYLVYIY